MCSMNDPRDIVVLGSTGSIGTQALDIVRRNPDTFRVVALSAGGGNLDLLAAQTVEFDVPLVAVAGAPRNDLVHAVHTAAKAANRSTRKAREPEFVVGPLASTIAAGAPADVVLNGITGSIGLLPTLAALDAGSTLALANKESLIVGGDLVKAKAAPGQIVPVDSEHSALAQALRSGTQAEVRRLVITASGGPFRGCRREDLAHVTPAQALAHPTWDMGKVVTTNSATLVNKGLEVIEAHLLFDVGFDRIDVVVHPQSIVHSMVEFVDGSTIAQASPPDMRLPIALGLAWPNRVPQAAPGCDWTTASTWEFFPLDEEAFPAVSLAHRVGEAGGTYPAVYNAANEECVEAFHAGAIGFLDIVDTLTRVVDEWEASPEVLANKTEVRDVETVLAAERWARRHARFVLGLTPVDDGSVDD